MKRVLFLLTLLCMTLAPATLGIASEPDNVNLPPLVSVKSVFGSSHLPVPLAIRAPINVGGDIAYILLSEVPAAAKLNHGINIEAGYWMLSARALPELTITIPQAGRFRMAVKLLDVHFRDASATAEFFVTTINQAAQLSGK